MKPKSAQQKKVQSNLPDSRGIQEKAQTDLTLPQPIELAKLAAILRPECSPANALKVAMEFYVEAVFFLRASPSGFEDLVRAFGSHERNIALMAEPLKQLMSKQSADTLELDPRKDDDAARQFLAVRGLNLKTARAVLNNIRRWRQDFRRSPDGFLRGAMPPSADSIIAGCERVKDGRKIYAIPKVILEYAANHAARRRSQSRRKAWETRQRKSSV